MTLQICQYRIQSRASGIYRGVKPTTISLHLVRCRIPPLSAKHKRSLLSPSNNYPNFSPLTVTSARRNSAISSTPVVIGPTPPKYTQVRNPHLSTEGLAYYSWNPGQGSQWDSSFPNTPFTDPAIMSMGMSHNHADPSIQMSMQQLGSYASNPGFGPPPGLTPPTQLRAGPNPPHSHNNVSMFQNDTVQAGGSAHGEYLFALQGEGAPRTPYRAPYLPQRGDSINNREPYYRAKAF